MMVCGGPQGAHGAAVVFVCYFGKGDSYARYEQGNRQADDSFSGA